MSNVTSLERSAEKLATANRRRSPAKPATGTYDSNGKRVIRHDPGRLPEILDELGAALAEYGENLFVFAGRLVRVYPAPESPGKGIARPRGALILHAVDGAHLAELAGRAALHERYDARSDAYKHCDCPRRVADAYLSRGYWPELRQLSGFVEAPIVTLSGRLLDNPGYDAETGLFLAFEKIPGYTAPDAKSTMNDSSCAAGHLLEAVSEFPFVDDTDRSAFLAGVMTGLLRRVLAAAPMMAVTAPSPGTGKTLIAETFAIIATGRRASVLSLGHDDAETEKRLAGVLLAGDACIALDNIERPLKGELLCQVASQQFVRLRPLGASGMVSIPTHALLVATGNNLSIVGDLKRRVSLIRLDARQERPEQRSFKRDHLDEVFARRGDLIRDALTICLAYIAAGSPAVDGLYPLGGFEHWDRLVRRPLVWLGLPDPLKASEALRDQDPDLEAMRLLFGSWNEEFSSEKKTAADVVSAGMEAAPMTSEYVRAELREALQLVCSEKPNARRLGYWLRSHRDRIVDGLTLKQAGADGHAKVARWSVTSAGDAGKAGDVSIPF
ncbi:hypothetical protein [Candidatus Accumulibacter sp. ACC007]|uniref:hypothetical protein n=1 Tax=Candidatus Accumulibacter sp. ACC007 TaxID=2823333 RepID=UPI0025BA59B2|nr:hypothetical protein [Candidatus Accumulibacter sp. ACC007]